MIYNVYLRCGSSLNFLKYRFLNSNLPKRNQSCKKKNIIIIVYKSGEIMVFIWCIIRSVYYLELKVRGLANPKGGLIECQHRERRAVPAAHFRGSSAPVKT